MHIVDSIQHTGYSVVTHYMMPNGMRVTFLKNYYRILFDDLGFSYCCYSGEVFLDTINTYKWFTENDIKFEDMTIEDAEILQFYLEAIK